VPIRAIVMLLIAVSLGAAGQVCLKLGVNQLGAGVGVLGVLRGIFTPYVFSGFVCYGLSSIVYLMALQKLDLSYAYPFVALSFVMVTLLSWWLLDETLPLLRVAGLVLIMGGVLTVAASYRCPPACADQSVSGQPAIDQPASGT
jgi:multidrug transporter EmrE-like cation transporter